jgi:hypothetical protein
MTYHGFIKNGTVVLDDVPLFPEGTEVQVQILPSAPAEKSGLGQRLMKYAGKADGLPADLARNHNHYLHRSPSKCT